MKLFETVLMVACAATLYGAPADSAEAKRTQWYRDAKFGMFIHWGPYSLASIEASWPIMTEGFNETEYRALPQRFNPENFDATALVRLAKAAGQKYMVITTKHHDGFVMFDSLFTEYKITKTPYQKDIVAELAEAAKEKACPWASITRRRTCTTPAIATHPNRPAQTGTENLGGLSGLCISITWNCS